MNASKVRWSSWVWTVFWGAWIVGSALFFYIRFTSVVYEANKAFVDKVFFHTPKVRAPLH